MAQHLARSMQAVGRHVHVIKEKNYCATVNHRNHSGRGGGLSRRSGEGRLSRQLGFTRAAGADLFEKGDRARLAVDEQLKLIAGQPDHKAALLIEDRDRTLDQVSVDANHIVAWLLLW